MMEFCFIHKHIMTYNFLINSSRFKILRALMHVFFSGIGGTGIGPIAQIALKAGYQVSGSDKRDSEYIKYLKSHGIDKIVFDQTEQSIAEVHQNNPIDWFVYTSALTMENDNPPEIEFCRKNNIKFSKRDAFLSEFLKLKNLKLIAIAGTHGKTTTTAMTVWLFKRLGIPVSYVLPAKTNFAQMGDYDEKSQYFVYEADEFDRNFLAFRPHLSIITGVSWDHHEIYLTQQDYIDAFKDFIGKSEETLVLKPDADFMTLGLSNNIKVLDHNDDLIKQIGIPGLYNRRDAYLALKAIKQLGLENDTPLLVKTLIDFPGLSRRMEEITPNLYSDYAHTPEKITAALNVAKELIDINGNKQRLIVIYEPLTNRRQHYIKHKYKQLFNQVDKLYWIPSYLAREDNNQPILSPLELISELDKSDLAQAAELNSALKENIVNHLNNNDLVVAISGGGGNSLDEWLRANFL